MKTTGDSPSVENRNFTELLPELGNEVVKLMKSEADLLRAEMNAKVDRMEAAVSSMAAGGVCLFAALLVLLQAVVVALTKAGIGAGWSSLIVGVVVGLIGIGLLSYGRGSVPSLTPRRSTTEASKTADMAREKMQ
ncbi:MAG: phage holin family protein [Hyphomicrobiaceae bacterium]